MSKRSLLILIAIVFIPSLLIRLYPVTSESFTHDAIVSQMAADKGIAANAWDRGDVFHLRRYHPPLLSYIIIVNNAVFGSDEFRARLYSILAGSLSCLVVAISVYTIGGRDKAAMIGGVLSGWLICLLPVNLYISRSANWDGVYSLFYMCTLLFLLFYLINPSLRTLAWAGTFAALTFLTCELGMSLLPAFAVIFVFDLKRGKRVRVLRDWGMMVLLAFALITLLWPSGVFNLDLFRTLRFRFYDSVVIERNLPWYRFFTTLFVQAPAYTLVMAAGVVTALLLLLLNRRKPDARQIDTKGFLVRMLPFAIYVITALILSFKQRLVYIHHIADLFPALTVVAVSAFVTASRTMTLFARTTGTVLCFSAVILSGVSAFDTDPHVVGPQEHPGYLGIRDFLKDHPEARTYYHYDYAMRFYLPDAVVVGSPEPWWTKDKLNMVKDSDFDFVICDQTMLDEEFPTVGVFADALYPEFEIVRTIYHRRTNEPVAWIFGRH
jgi:hypothetical protein